MTFTQAIHQIRELAAEDITSIVADYIALKPSGNSMKGCCPFHDEKTPSFHVSDHKGIYKCFGCGVGGDAIDFVMRMEGNAFYEAIYQLAERYHLKIEKYSNGKSRQSRPKPVPVAGLKQVRFDIRKAKSVTIVCNGAAIDQFDTKAIVQISPLLTHEQAKALKKYTQKCTLVLDQIPWPDVQEMIATVLQHEFTVTVLKDGKPVDWIYYVLDTYNPDRQDIIKLLAAIPDGITRSVYMTEYTKQLYKISES